MVCDEDEYNDAGGGGGGGDDDDGGDDGGGGGDGDGSGGDDGGDDDDYDDDDHVLTLSHSPEILLVADKKKTDYVYTKKAHLDGRKQKSKK